MVHGLSIPVSTFADHFDELFEQLEDQIKPTGRPRVLIIEAGGMYFCDPQKIIDVDMLAFLKVEPILSEVRAMIMHDKLTPALQLELQLEDKGTKGGPEVTELPRTG